MNFNDFCTSNGIERPDIMESLDHAQFPQDEFTPEFSIIIYVFSGMAPVWINGQEYMLRRRSITLLQPGQKIRFQPTEQLVYKTIPISGRLQDFINMGGMFLTMFVTEEYPVIRITSAYNENLLNYFRAIDAICRIQSNPYKTDSMISIFRALIYSTGHYVFRSLKFTGGDLHKFVNEYSSGMDDTVTRFTKLVEENCVRTRHLSFYAGKLDYNPKYLSALIKREVGVSGQALIDRYSAMAAMAKLSYGRQSIKEISDDMNFQSQSDFGKFFKRMTGTSPLAYRKSRFSRYSDTGE